jgi:hypothetical protein
MHCMNRCPRKSIQTPHLFVAVIWWLVFFVIPLFILKELLQLNPDETRFYNLIFDVVTHSNRFPNHLFQLPDFTFSDEIPVLQYID